MNEPKPDEYAEVEALCPECQTGVQRLQYITYYTRLNHELITVPNFPAWVCDLCGRRKYDSRAVNWLNILLNPATGRKRVSLRRKGIPPMDRPQP